MSNFVYQSWLTDRGVNSPGSRPYDVLEAKIDTNSRAVLLSVGSDQSTRLDASQIEKLASALVGADNAAVSWMLLLQGAAEVSLTDLRNLMPALSKVVWLDDSKVVDLEVFRTEMATLASRPLEFFYGPSLATMNANPTVKSSFWNQLRSWNV